MAKFKFRIGTKLGLTAGIAVLLVGGMLANQLHGNQSIEAASQLVISNYLNKSNAQSAETGIARAQLASRDIGAARSTAELDDGMRDFRAGGTAAIAQVDSAL